jgi:pilus assembly protein CpaB
MMQRALPIAAVAAALSMLLLLLYLRQYEQRMSGGERVKLLVAVKPIHRSDLVTDDMLGVREVPLAYVEPRAIKANERSKILGVRVAEPLNAQDIVMWTDLAVASKERDLSSLVQFGNRAVTVSAGTGDAVKGYALIHPGDYVDVVVTTADASHPNGDARSSAVLLQKVLVLAVGLDTTSTVVASETAGTQKQARPERRDLVLTLSLNIQETQLVALATEKGHLSVALRNPEDQQVAEGIPDLTSSSLLESRARTAIQEARRTTAPVAGPIKIQSEAVR